MKILSLDLNLEGVTLSKDLEKVSNIEIAARVIRNIILSYGQDHRGFDEEERRKYYKISDLLDEAVKENKKEIEMEDDWFGFLKKCKRECHLFPDKLLQLTEALINNVDKRL